MYCPRMGNRGGAIWPTSFGDRVRLLVVVHHRLRLLAFPMRTSVACRRAGRPRDLPVPAQGASTHARVSDHAGPIGCSRLRTQPCCLPHHVTSSAPGTIFLSRLNGWPVYSPADASPAPSRATTHGSGPMWVAIPSSQRTCTVYSLPVSRRTTCKKWSQAELVPNRVPSGDLREILL